MKRIVHHRTYKTSKHAKTHWRPLWACLVSSLGHSRPLILNTEKLELPSISQVQTRGSADTPWFSSHYSQRPLLSSDRLPDLHLPASYISTPGFSSSRLGGLDHLPNGHGTQFPPLQTGSYSNLHTGTGLKTPSPSPTSQCSAPPSHESAEDTAERSHCQASQPIQSYAQSADHFSGAMNHQQQYLGSEPSQISAGQPYQSQPTTSGGMSQYPSYPQQPPVLQSGPSSYAPAPTHYGGQYGYPNSITSPQGAGHPVSSSVGPQMNSGLLPLPSRFS